MTLKDLLDKIRNLEEQISRRESLLESIKQYGDAEISCRSSWRCSVDPQKAIELVEMHLEVLKNDLGRLCEAQKAAEITMEGWLNSSGGKIES